MTSSEKTKKSDTWPMKNYDSLYLCISASFQVILKTGKHEVVNFCVYEGESYCSINCIPHPWRRGLASTEIVLCESLIIQTLAKIPNSCVTISCECSYGWLLVVGQKAATRLTWGGKVSTTLHLYTSISNTGKTQIICYSDILSIIVFQPMCSSACLRYIIYPAGESYYYR